MKGPLKMWAGGSSDLLEVMERDGLARVIEWVVEEGNTVRTPLVLVMNDPRSEAFSGAELTLKKELGIPEGKSCPMTFVDHVEESGRLGKDGKVLLVGPRPPASVPDTVELVVSGNIQGLIGDPKRLVRYLMELRRAVGYSRLLYAPAVGVPHEMALLSYLGIDIFDSIPLSLAARKGRMLSSDGVHSREEVLSSNLCHCPVCAGGMADGGKRNHLHNYHTALLETRRIRHAISQGTIRELVEARVRTEPWMVAAMRDLDLRYHALFEQYLPISKPFLLASSREALHRPEIIRFQRRLRERYLRPAPADVLLLLPCSARKPYSSSATHKAISNALSRCRNQWAVHGVVVTSPLGVVPMDLELFYPANVYDIAVTGDWDGPEIDMIREGLSWLIDHGQYRAVVSFIDGMPFIDDIIEAKAPASRTLHPERVRRKDDLDILVAALNEVIVDAGLEKVDKRKRFMEDLSGFARFQFGPGAEGMVGSAKRGRDHIKLLLEGEQSGTLNPERGLISLTLKGGEHLMSKGLYLVEIEDFDPKGTVFSIGVRQASDDIRPGDDVVVVKKDGLVGVGVAKMSGPEMVEARRGGAVKMRHRTKHG